MNENLPCAVHSQQIKSIEKRVERVEQKNDDMIDMKMTLNRLSIIIEKAEERDRDRDELNKKQNETLDKINDNLIKLNKDTESNTNEINTLKTQVIGVRSEITEVKNHGTINLTAVFKQGLLGGIFAVMGYYIAKLLGVK